MASKFMLAHRADIGVLSHDDKVSEVKYDGTRCHVKWTPTSLEMWSRDSSNNGYRRNYAEIHNLPEVEHDIQELRAKHPRGWLDVELCWFNEFGRSIMRGSQVRCGTTRRQSVLEKIHSYPITAMSFDLLELDNEELISEPYVHRKNLLEELHSETQLPHLKYVPYSDDKVGMWTEVLKMGGEGVMAKTLLHKYEFRRSREWLKLKDEKITSVPRKIVGYTMGEGERAPFFGSLVMQNEDGTYGGNVGGGFNTDELRWWTEILKSARQVQKPFSPSEVGEDYTAVEVSVKVKVRYLEVTPRGVLRMPVYISAVRD